MQDPSAQVIFTKNIDDNFIKLRRAKKDEELQSDEWKELEKAYYEHLKWRFKYPEKTFGRQSIFSIIITVVVFILILSGLVFSFYQLKIALSVGDFDSLSTAFSFEAAGKISVKSSVVGAVVLIISLAFFYLYLINVYKIQYTKPPLVGLSESDIDEKLDEKFEKINEEIRDKLAKDH